MPTVLQFLQIGTSGKLLCPRTAFCCCFEHVKTVEMTFSRSQRRVSKFTTLTTQRTSERECVFFFAFASRHNSLKRFHHPGKCGCPVVRPLLPRSVFFSKPTLRLSCRVGKLVQIQVPRKSNTLLNKCWRAIRSG